MDNPIFDDLVAAHADALNEAEGSYRKRYSALFPDEVQQLEPLFELAESLYVLFQKPIKMRPEFRADLKASLVAQAHQQRFHARREWRWAAIGATVAGVIAAAAWRGNYHRGAI